MKELRDLRAPGEGDAQRRAWELTAAAAAERAAASPEDAHAGGARTGRPRSRRGALALAGAAATAALLAITPAGAAVSDFVRSVVDDQPPARASGLEALPGGGRVLVLAERRDGGPEPWIAGEGVHRRLGGAADAAAWSPHGRFVAIGRESELFAVDPKGERRWSIPAPGPVRDVRWSPDGFRVAYTAGAELRVVAGDGTGDRRVAGMRPGEPPGFGSFDWRPGPGHVLAFDKRQSLFLADLDRRRVLWRVTVRDEPRVLFSPAGDRLLLAGARDVRVLDPRDGRVLQRVRSPRGWSVVDAAWDRTGRRLAVVRKTSGRAEVLVGRPHGRTIRLRRRFSAGELGLVGFSPDNRWLLVDWTETQTWLFLPAGGGRARQLTDVPRRFRARGVMPQAWCCAP